METTPFSKEFVEQQRQVLLTVRERLSGQRVSNDSDASNGDDFGDLSAAVTAAENALTLVSNARQTLQDVNVALAKIERGNYGFCEFSGEPIGQERLEAIPWARYTVEAQMAFEKDGRHRTRSVNHAGLFEDSLKTAEDSDGEEVAEAD